MYISSAAPTSHIIGMEGCAMIAEKAMEKIKEVPFPMATSMVLLALLCVALSLLAIPSVSETVLRPAIDVLIQPELYSTTLIGN